MRFSRLLSRILGFLLLASLLITLLYSFIKAIHVSRDRIISFQVCGGLTNQRIAIVQGIIMALKLKRTLILPKLYKSFDDVSPDVDFERVYDLDHLRKAIGEMVSLDHYRELSFWASDFIAIKDKRYRPSVLEKKTAHLGAIRTDCAFNSLLVTEDPSISALYMKIDRSLIFQKRFYEIADNIVRRLPEQYIALHYRAEDDWIAHCKFWKGGNNCLTNTMEIDRYFNLLKSNLHTVYVAGSTDVGRHDALRRLTATHTYEFLRLIYQVLYVVHALILLL